MSSVPFRKRLWTNVTRRDAIAMSLGGALAAALIAGLAFSASNAAGGTLDSKYGPLIAATNSGIVGSPVLRTPDDRARDADLTPTQLELGQQ